MEWAYPGHGVLARSKWCHHREQEGQNLCPCSPQVDIQPVVAALAALRRIQSIKAYLMQRFHIAPERVQAVGYGSTKSIEPNDIPEGRTKNRRVEVVSLGRAL
jgi:hypothetical protein